MQLPTANFQTKPVTNIEPVGDSPHHRPEDEVNPLYTYGIRHLCSYLFGITLFFLFLLSTYNQQQESHIRQLIERESQHLLLARTIMSNQLARVTLDVLALSKQQHLKQQLSGQQHGFGELPQDYKQLDQAETTMSGNVMLLNEQGFWLHGGETNENWAFMFSGKRKLNFHNRFPRAWQAITESDFGSIKTDQGYFIFQTIQAGRYNSLLNQEINDNDSHWPTWKLVSRVPADNFEAELSDISRLLIMFFVLAATVIAIGTMMYTRAQIKHHRTKKKIHYLAHHDALTGLCNRRLFMEMIDHELLHAKRSHTSLVLMYLDLDRFKPINDQYGHESGDLVLKGVAQRLKDILRESDTLCRLGGDEFAAILPNPGTKQQVENVAQRILNAFEKPFLIHGNQLNMGISIGLANYRPPLQSRDALLHEADQAMYQSKKAGRNCYSFLNSNNSL